MKENGNMIQRTEYISQLEPFIGKDIIKVITGMRRSGKSTLLETIRSKLLDDGIAPSNNIIIINFESMQWEDAASSAQAFYQTVLELTQNIQGKIYLFFDEVQAVPNWERAINSLRVDLDCDIYITGSNSKLLARRTLDTPSRKVRNCGGVSVFPERNRRSNSQQKPT